MSAASERSLEQRSHRAGNRVVATGELGELIAIEYLEFLLAPADGATADKPTQRAIGVHQRQAKRVGHMLLRYGNPDRVSLAREADLADPVGEMQQKVRTSLYRAAPSYRQELLIEQLLGARR
jgi:hypothetical protein